MCIRNIGKMIAHGRLYHGGNELLRYRIEFPHFEDRENINNTHAELMKNCEIFCREKLFLGLCSKNDSRNEKERERYSYKLSFRVTHNDMETVSFLFGALLECGRERLMENLFVTNWSICDEQLLPPAQLARYRAKGQKIKIEKGIFINAGRLETLKTDMTFFAEKK